jgi:hypothetical protein
LTSSTRRFFARPSSPSLLATGGERADADSLEPRGRDAVLAHEGLHHRLGARLRERHVRLDAPDHVRVADHLQVERRVRLQQLPDLGERGRSAAW